MKVADVHCQICNQFLCQRQGNLLIYHSLRIPIVKSQPIPCPACGTTTYLKRDRKKHIDLKAKEGTIVGN